MPLSPEVQAAVDEIRRNKSLTQSLMDANSLLGEQIAALKAKVDAIPTKQEMSAEDKKALQDEVAALDELNDRMESAVKANTNAGSAGGGGDGAAAPEPKPDPQAEFKQMTPDQLADARGQQKEAGPAEGIDNGPGNPPAIEGAPLMPNVAFNPAGVNTPRPAPGDGQPNQPEAIETAGGFVIAGGGSTQRAPGSRPESPSSSVVVPADPDAKAPVSTADEVKSGLGDSSQNALLGNDGRVPESGESQQERAADPAEQARQDALREEQARREANPLNLTPEQLAEQRGADKANQAKPARDENTEPGQRPDGEKNPAPAA